MRILSGMQPSGKAHIGNYLGAMRQHIAAQSEEHECIYFIANLHSLTTIRNKELLRGYTVDLALDYLALGLDPEKTIFFRQSDVPEHAELTWILNCITGMSVLERAHAWKDSQQKKLKDPSVGLFDYPILMAADILLYGADAVPVGKDQKQHIEIARDSAIRFNALFGEVFTVPEPIIKEEVATVIGTDGEKKMSKSYGNTIDIFADDETLKKQIMGMKTDSIPLDAPKNPDTCNVFALYRHFADSNEQKTLASAYRKGGFGYSEAKKELFEKIKEYFREAKMRREKLAKNADHVHEILLAGAEKARSMAAKTLDIVKEKTGLR